MHESHVIRENAFRYLFRVSASFKLTRSECSVCHLRIAFPLDVCYCFSIKISYLVVPILKYKQKADKRFLFFFKILFSGYFYGALPFGVKCWRRVRIIGVIIHGANCLSFVSSSLSSSLSHVAVWSNI